MLRFEDITFVDCVLIDFSINKIASQIEIITEAYYAPEGRNKTKGNIQISFIDISSLEMNANDEFRNDLLLEYSPNGADYKANEIYNLKSTYETRLKKYRILLNSDFLELKLFCKEYHISEVNIKVKNLSSMDNQ